MKYLKHQENFLHESPILYKSVCINDLESILSSGIKLVKNNLIGYRSHKTTINYKYSSSFTRSNYYFYIPPGEIIGGVRLILDRNKLKSNYILRPINYHSKDGSQMANRYEAEERVFSDSPTNIHPKFILKVEVSKELYDKAANMENPFNITIEVNRFLRIRTRNSTYSTKFTHF
jgi:hypothetical protein